MNIYHYTIMVFSNNTSKNTAPIGALDAGLVLVVVLLLWASKSLWPFSYKLLTDLLAGVKNYIKEVMIFYYVEIKIMDIEVKKEHDSNHKGKEEEYH